ncbi:hypothetical protein [Polluticoccus soli]|uniref:hypothetical protein n=1 Tax=Polluticoccus soli TaxID=3034150 RepID=UPI0023E2CBB9|nr:hypothetical protein [Flavipsychrobacter sp. JY13-12]
MTTNQTINEQLRFNEFLIAVIRKTAFASGSQLSELLVSQFQISSEYARKIVQRASTAKILKSSKPYTFGKGQYIYVLPNNELEYDQVMEICKRSKPPMYRLMASIRKNSGIVSKYDAIKITGAPKGKSSTKVETIDDILKLLSRMDFVYEAKDHRDITYVIKKEDFVRLPESNEKELMQSYYNRMTMDCSLIPDVLRWMNSINLFDNKTSVPIYRNKKMPAVGASHNNILWDAYCYTKTTGINDILGAAANTTDKQTMVALDIVLSSEYSELMLDGFLSRIQINRNSVKGAKRKIFPIVVYNDISELVLNKLKKLGILAIDIGSIFGAKIYSVIQRLGEIDDKLLYSSNNVETTVEAILQDIRDAGQEDALKDLKGVLFEALMYPLIKNLYPDALIERGRTLAIQPANGEKEYYEYDYIVHSNRPKELVVIELKGYNSAAAISVGDKNTKSTLGWFFRRTLPFAGKFFKDKIADGMTLKGIYMTTANFWKEAQDYIVLMNKGKLKPRALSTGYSRVDLIALLNDKGFEKEVQIINKFYVKQEEI